MKNREKINTSTITFVSHEKDFTNHAPHHFHVHDINTGESIAKIDFQNGPVSEGINGVTNEDLLEMVAVRLRSYEESPFKHVRNANALGYIEQAIRELNQRTKERQTRGVEGTHTI